MRHVDTAPRVVWTRCEYRLTKAVEVAEVLFTPDMGPKAASPLRYVALRVSPQESQLFDAGSKVAARTRRGARIT